ncbi:hypothetical protein ACQ4M3_37240 [Leptolyngbya sp. AN03gr2]|uniref:hypothetical protein n=1 Tax=unclassified Leptolyngbya TaxID=2650499 RepID=UPI003D3137DF
MLQTSYDQIVERELSQVRLSKALSDDDWQLLNQWTRYLAMLNVPTPRWRIVRWFCNYFNLVEQWYRWEQAGRLASAMQQLPQDLFELAWEIVCKANQE